MSGNKHSRAISSSTARNGSGDPRSAPFEKALFTRRFDELLVDGTIRRSAATFKIRLFLRKAESSLLIAQHHKELQPTGEQPEKLYWNYWAIIISYYAMLYAAKAAILTKGYEASSHDAARIAIGHLLVPGRLEREDLELLDQAQRIFEDEYVKYFEEAMTASQTARYQARPSYTERQVADIFGKATAFIAKIGLIIGGQP